MKIKNTVYIIAGIAIILLIIYSKSPNRVKYTTFFREKCSLMALESEEILLLYPDKTYERKRLLGMLETYDEAYRIFVDISGMHPEAPPDFKKKLPLAVVGSTCGPGCGLLGAKGIEITESKFASVYRLYADSAKHDHLFFYELGRNFWFYEDVLIYPGSPVNDDIRTGFAVFMRNVVIRELGIEVGSINGVPYQKYTENNHEMWERYITDSTATLTNTLLGDKNAIEGKTYNRPNLWAAFWWDLYSREEYNKVFLKKLLKELQSKSRPESEREIFRNFYRSACNAANKDLNRMFTKEWKWHILSID